MKFKKISTRMLTFVLPVLIIPMLILTLVSIASSQKAIGEQLDNRMYAELSAAERHVEEQ